MATDVAISFPDMDLPPGATITVTLDDASADVTQLNVYGYSPGHGEPLELPPVEPLLAFVPQDGP